MHAQRSALSLYMFISIRLEVVFSLIYIFKMSADK